jgi:hypothetical protein
VLFRLRQGQRVYGRPGERQNPRNRLLFMFSQLHRLRLNVQAPLQLARVLFAEDQHSAARALVSYRKVSQPPAAGHHSKGQPAQRVGFSNATGSGKNPHFPTGEHARPAGIAGNIPGGYARHIV